MKFTLEDNLIDEGPHHIGWYKIYKLNTDFNLAIYTFKYHGIPKVDLEWGGIIQRGSEESLETMLKLEKKKVFDDRVWIERISHKGNHYMPILAFKDCDILYVCNRLIECVDEYN